MVGTYILSTVFKRNFGRNNNDATNGNEKIHPPTLTNLTLTAALSLIRAFNVELTLHPCHTTVSK